MPADIAADDFLGLFLVNRTSAKAKARFLRQPCTSSAPRLVAKSGRAAGIGVQSASSISTNCWGGRHFHLPAQLH
jgi:hypothetical protein